MMWKDPEKLLTGRQLGRTRKQTWEEDAAVSKLVCPDCKSMITQEQSLVKIIKCKLPVLNAYFEVAIPVPSGHCGRLSGLTGMDSHREQVWSKYLLRTEEGEAHRLRRTKVYDNLGVIICEPR